MGMRWWRRVKRILVVLKSDGIGGVERQVSRLIETCRRRNVGCDVVAISPATVAGGLLADYGLRVLGSRLPWTPFVRVHQLLQLRTLVRTAAYDVVLACGPSANALVSLARPRPGLAVISERGNPFIPRRRRWNALMMWTYRRADVLILQTRRLAADLRACGHVPRKVVVGAPAIGSAVGLVPPSAARPHVIATVGRLVASKRVGDLIAAFARVASGRPDWRLVVVGDGPERESLEQQVISAGLEGRVSFTGFVLEPWTILSSASIFAFCSAHEGFPNAVLEAAASGCALVSSDCPYGPSEILDAGRLGALYPVGDVAALSDHLARFMDNPDERVAFAEKAFASLGRYRRESGDEPWFETLAELVAEGR